MRTIKYIIVHCTAGNAKATMEDLAAEFKRKGWTNPGYHYVITSDGQVHQMLDEANISNGVKGYNSISINVAYTGGVDKSGKACDTRTEAQKSSMRTLLKALHAKYPQALIRGHRDFSPDLNHNGSIEPNEWIKFCPAFDAKTEYKDL